MKKDKKLEDLLQKIVLAKNHQEKMALIAILKNKYPDEKIPK